MPPERKEASADAAPSCPINSSPRFERASPRATRLLPPLPACSKFTPQPSRGYSLDQVRGRSAAPNSMQRSTPNNLQSDNRRLLEIQAPLLARVLEGEIAEYPVFTTR